MAQTDAILALTISVLLLDILLLLSNFRSVRFYKRGDIGFVLFLAVSRLVTSIARSILKYENEVENRTYDLVLTLILTPVVDLSILVLEGSNFIHNVKISALNKKGVNRANYLESTAESWEDLKQSESRVLKFALFCEATNIGLSFFIGWIPSALTRPRALLVAISLLIALVGGVGLWFCSAQRLPLMSSAIIWFIIGQLFLVLIYSVMNKHQDITKIDALDTAIRQILFFVEIWKYVKLHPGAAEVIYGENYVDEVYLSYFGYTGDSDKDESKTQYVHNEISELEKNKNSEPITAEADDKIEENDFNDCVIEVPDNIEELEESREEEDEYYSMTIFKFYVSQENNLNTILDKYFGL